MTTRTGTSKKMSVKIQVAAMFARHSNQLRKAQLPEFRRMIVFSPSASSRAEPHGHKPNADDVAAAPRDLTGDLPISPDLFCMV